MAHEASFRDNRPLVTDGNGAIANRQGYTAYSEKRHGDDLLTDHNFTGQKRDATGLLYYQARYYDPAVGKCICWGCKPRVYT